MYERGFSRTNDGAVKIAGNDMNPALQRIQADDRVTFLNSGGGKSGTTGTDRFMRTGEAKVSGSSAVITNSNFNPHSRPNFAALNYGRMKHGPATAYGRSYFALNDDFKVNALYYLGDTFDKTMNAMMKGTYGMLLSVVQHAEDDPVKKLIDAVYFGKELTDSEGGANLLEAHLYQEIYFTTAIKKVVISEEDLGMKGLSSISAEERQTVRANAQEFCTRNNIKVEWIQ